MTTKQFAQSVKLVESGADLSAFDYDNLIGCGLPDFKPVFTTIEAVARLVCYQARTFAGTWDAVELDNMARIAKAKFLIVND